MKKGFTILELLIVVAIIGLLATIAIPSYTHYINRVKVSKAVLRLGQIKLRQESYKSEFSRYMSTAANPSEIPTDPVLWDESVDTWPWLGFNPNSVRFQYITTAGLPGTVPESDSMGWIRRSDTGREHGGDGSDYAGTDYWFVSQARADLDGDGNILLIEAYSTGHHVWISSPRGWE